MKFIFLGPQGSGKSTQAKMIAASLGLPYLEMSQLLRERAREKGKDAQQINKAFETGTLVPPAIVLKIINDKLSEINNGYVLDAFPRNKTQLDGFNDKVDKVFYVKVSDKEAQRRLMLRRREDDTEEIIAKRLAIYHEETEPILDEFRTRGALVEIDGERTIEEIAHDIEERIRNAKLR